MNIYSLSIPLQVSAEHSARLKSLQETFALVCNALAPVVQETRCWNRVALHHMMYKTLREKFPQLGSQMVCNAIYSVSRTSRLVFQSPQSPFNIQRLADKPLPLLQFLPSAPVYFDRHTLSIKAGTLSMYTLDGRMRFELNVREEDLNRFKTLKLHEVVLQSVTDQYILNFSFANDPAPIPLEEGVKGEDASYWPEYIVIDQVNLPTVATTATGSALALAPATDTFGPEVTAPIQVKHRPVTLKFQLQTNASSHPALGLHLNERVNGTSSFNTQVSEPISGLGIQLKLSSPLTTQALQYTTAVPAQSSTGAPWPNYKEALSKPHVPSAAKSTSDLNLKSSTNPNTSISTPSETRGASLTDASAALIHPLGATP